MATGIEERVFKGLFPWLVDDYLLCVSVYYLPFLHVSVSKFPFFLRTPVLLGKGLL